MSDERNPAYLDGLLSRAEAMSDRDEVDLEGMDPQRLRKLVHDLQVHRIELELQNEELLRTQIELERSRSRYAALFNQAPVGYLVLDRSGIIRNANVTFSNMVGIDAFEARDKPFSMLVDERDRPTFLARFRAMFNRPVGKRIELRLKDSGGSFWVRVEAIPSLHGTAGDLVADAAEELLLTVSDIRDQKAIEESLRSSEEYLATTLHSVGDAVITTDIRGHVTDLNPVATVLTGYSKSEAVDRDIREIFRIINNSTRAPVENPIIRAVREKRIVGLENHTILVSKEGDEYQIADSAAPITKSDGTTMGAVLVFRNVTEEYRRQEERRFQSLLLAQIHDLVLATDAEGIITYANEAVARLLEYDQHELVGKHVGVLGSGAESGPTQDDIVEATREYGEWRGVVTNVTKSGRCVLLDSRVRIVHDEEREIVGMVGVSTDVTERDRILAELAESERQKSLLLDSMHEVFLYLDRDLTVQWANRAAERYFAGRHSTIDGKLCHELWHGRSEPCDQCPVLCAATGQRFCTTTFETADGRVWDVRGYPIIGPDGNTVAVAELARDVTEIERRKEEQAKLEDQLLQAQKLESIGRLAGGIAHDFNNLLTSIAGNTELAAQSLPHEHPASEHLAEIDLASDRAARLTAQLLAFSRKQVMAQTVCDPNELVEKLSSMIGRLLGEDLDFTTGCLAAGRIRVDRGQIEQCLVNLSINARDAMPGGGRFVLSAVDSRFDDEIVHVIPELSPGAYVLLSAHDTGTGMSAVVLERIFEPFFTTKPIDRGTGLGLATTFGIVKQHGGHIEVKSIEGVGSSFYLFLPLVEDPVRAGTPTVSCESGTGATVELYESDRLTGAIASAVLVADGYSVTRRGGGATLAVIDPERSDCALLERRYEREGVRVVVTSSGIPSELLGAVRRALES